jgi:PEP-CTERM motif
MTRKLLRTLLPIVFFTFVTLTSATFAFGDTISFNSLEQPGNTLVLVSDPYSEAGYRISNGGQLYYAQQSAVEYAGSAGLHERITNGLLTLTRVDGNAFTLSSIDLSILHPNGASPPVVFTGTLVGGGTVTQTFTPTVFGFQTFVFNSSFTNLTSVSWRQGTDELNAHQFDNIVVSSVPEPSAMLLFGTGLMASAARIRKRRRLKVKEE